MGDIKRKTNRFARPRKMFDSARISMENDLVKKFGLKNKREIWKTAARVSELRNQAKKLIPKAEEEKQEFFKRLQSKGLSVNVIADVLALTTEDLLGRRLQTIVFNKGLARTALEARQFITHKSVYVDGRLVNIPSFMVTKYLENKISVKVRTLKAAGVHNE